MPKTLTQYRVFIGSPGGLKLERERFRSILEKCTRNHGEPRGVTFYPIGWEDTIGGAGRPQAIINEDLKQCDYAVFILHDRWGTPTGSHSSGTEEEWELAEKLYEQAKIRNIALFFKDVHPAQLRDPGDELRKVLKFRQGIEDSKKYLFKAYGEVDEFCETLEGYLAKWLRDHGGDTGDSSARNLASVSAASGASETEIITDTKLASPGFIYWFSEATRLSSNKPSTEHDHAGSIFCATRAMETAGSILEKARARNLIAVIQGETKKFTEALANFTIIVTDLESSNTAAERALYARARHNMGITLSLSGSAQ